MNYLASWRLPRPSGRKGAEDSLRRTGAAGTFSKKTCRAATGEAKDEHQQNEPSEESPDTLLSHPSSWAMTLQAARASLGNQILTLAVKLPATCLEKNEWLAVKTYDVVNEAQMVWSFVVDHCTCKSFKAGNFRLAGVSAAAAEAPRPAKEHVRRLLMRIKKTLLNSSIFVVEPGEAFPPDFEEHVRGVMAQLMQLYAHVYREHFGLLAATETVAYVNCCFKHALLFGSEFHLLSAADLSPLANLVKIFLSRARQQEIAANATSSPQSSSICVSSPIEEGTRRRSLESDWSSARAGSNNAEDEAAAAPPPLTHALQQQACCCIKEGVAVLPPPHTADRRTRAAALSSHGSL